MMPNHASEARLAGSYTVTRVEPLETLPDSKALTSQNSRSSELLDELLGEILDSERGTKNKEQFVWPAWTSWPS
jgi:hypothetical protein